MIVASLDEPAKVFLRVPPAATSCSPEPLAKTNSADKYQIYGEVGLRYGNERAHSKITNLAPS